MARNSTERLVSSAIWSREDPLFPAHRQLGVDPLFNIYYKCGIMLILKLWKFDCSVELLYCYSSTWYLTKLCLFPRELLCFRAYGQE